MKPEARLYQLVKKQFSNIIWTRIENTVVAGVPDLLGYNKKGYFFTLELKVAERERIRFSPHQIAFHKTHPNNTFILVQALGPRAVDRYQMFRGSRIMELVACGLELRRSSEEPSELEACCLGLEACCLELESLGA